MISYSYRILSTENSLNQCRHTVPISPSFGAKSPHRADNYFLAVVSRAAFHSTAGYKHFFLGLHSIYAAVLPGVGRRG